MRHALRLMLMLILAGAGAGCGSASSGNAAEATAGPTRVGPHGGRALALPAESGFVEVVAEYPRTRSKAGKPVIAAYFLRPDLAAPLSPAPVGVRVVAGMPGREPITAPLSPAPVARDRAGVGAARFASEPIDIDPDSASGELTATVNGQSFTGAFHIGR